MKTENCFNAYFTKEVKKLGTKFKIIKFSDRFHIGVSDWIIFYEGRSIAVEAKFIKSIPKGRGKLLSHPVSGPQIGFLKSMGLAGVPAFVLIGIGETKDIALLHSSAVPDNGNFIATDFQKDWPSGVNRFKFDAVAEMLHHMFCWRSNERSCDKIRN